MLGLIPTSIIIGIIEDKIANEITNDKLKDHLLDIKNKLGNHKHPMTDKLTGLLEQRLELANKRNFESIYITLKPDEVKQLLQELKGESK